MQGDAGSNANKLVVENLDLVGHLVNQLAAGFPRHVDRGELWSAGVLGLVEASRRFDPEIGIPFHRYAAIRIKGAIIDSTRNRDWTGRRVRRRLREVEAAQAAHINSTGRAPTDAELAAMVGCSEDDLRLLRERAERATLLRLDWETTDDGDAIVDLVEETDEAYLPDASLEQRELLGTLRVALQHLPHPQKEVLERYYLQGELLQDIAADFGVTEARVSQIRSQAINSLRAYLADLYQGVPEVDANAPGRAARQQFIAMLATHSTWRSRLEAAGEEGAGCQKVG